MAKMNVALVPKAGADLEIVDREIPEPGPGQVSIVATPLALLRAPGEHRRGKRGKIRTRRRRIGAGCGVGPREGDARQ